MMSFAATSKVEASADGLQAGGIDEDTQVRGTP
jgi:hypothetical protein